MSRYKYEEKAERNYIAEARELTSGLKRSQLYELYEVAVKQKQRSQTPERDAELDAVMKVIESRRDLDQDLIRMRKRGYSSSMAADARAKDGNTQKWKRKV